MRVDELDYHLPDSLIASKPTNHRDASRLMVLDRISGEIKAHTSFAKIIDWLTIGDLLVVNETKVLPARFYGKRANTGGKIEGLFIETRNDDIWSVMIKSKGMLKPGEKLVFNGLPENTHALTLIEKKPDSSWVAKKESDMPTDQLLNAIGSMPLPPYIVKKRKAEALNMNEDYDRERYQTVYSETPGAVAAPTAGLHFTEELLEQINAKGIEIASLTLHVGMGTFQPVRSDDLDEHPMHSEWFSVSADTQKKLKQVRGNGGRIIAVGTTSVRALESLPSPLPMKDYEAVTDILIQPGYTFNWLDGLITNFHLPKSTLLALVGAVAGLDSLKQAYEEAVNQEYRFYSYGDAMLFI